jgi:hypothetical protein
MDFTTDFGKCDMMFPTGMYELAVYLAGDSLKRFKYFDVIFPTGM